MARLQTVHGVRAVAEGGAALAVLRRVDDAVPEVQGERLSRRHEREHLHRHVQLVQRLRAEVDLVPARENPKALKDAALGPLSEESCGDESRIASNIESLLS